MVEFTDQEYADIHFVYGFCNGNALGARREYARRYPQRRLPNSRVFSNTHTRMVNGTLAQRGGGRERNVDRNDEILGIVDRHPEESSRSIARILGVSQSKVWRVLNREGLHPFHYTTVQDLIEPIDPASRRAFCNQLIDRDRANPNFLSSIVWTDESQFTRNGIINFHNDHLWTEENPHAKKTMAFQRRFGVNVWAGVIGNELIGPYILPDRINGVNYLQFLIDFQPELLDTVPLAARREGLIYQHDGCPAHFAVDVRHWLDRNYPGRWIGRGGPVPWPARSPDLTPCDFYLWGYMKSLVYAVRIETREQLIERIMQASETVRENMRQFDMKAAVRNRLQLCVEQNGGHIEHLM